MLSAVCVCQVGQTFPSLHHLTFIKSLSSKCARPVHAHLPADASDLLWEELLPPSPRLPPLWALVPDELLNDILPTQTSLITPLKKLPHVRNTALLPAGRVIHTCDEREREPARERRVGRWIEADPSAGSRLEAGNAAETRVNRAPPLKRDSSAPY